MGSTGTTRRAGGERPIIIGLSAFYHDAACCLLRGGALVAAAQEERFSRRKHDPRLPVEAFRFCLEAGGIGPHEVDAMAFYEQPETKLERQVWSGRVPATSARADPGAVERRIREGLGYDGRLLFFPHHLSHAASAFDFSGFDEAALLTVDGVGEWTTTAFARGSSSGIELLAEVAFPHSLGLLYSTLTAYLGFPVNDGEARVMGLAAYGRPRFLEALRQLVRVGKRGLDFTLDIDYFDFINGGKMYNDELCVLLGTPPRRPDEPLTRVHQDLAASVQALLEELLLTFGWHLYEETGLPRLCLAGGVALNCVANGRIRREGPFRQVFVQPAAGDAGGALGAAALAHRRLTGQKRVQGALRDARCGPAWSADQVVRLLEATGARFCDHRGDESGLLAAVADRLARHQVVAWFQGSMELGPRALGARSLLADPRDPDARERLNRTIKRREPFRPFAPAVLAGRAAAHFDLDVASPFMLETARVRSDLDLPAITHVDGSARVQTVEASEHPRFARLLAAFESHTGCPVLLNTSFNRAGEPIVCTPADALLTFAVSGVDALVIEDALIDRCGLPSCWQKLLPWWSAAEHRKTSAMGPLDEHLYTFV